MSGTSLDGVDLALCSIDDNGWQIVDATTVEYSLQWRGRLAGAAGMSALDYALTHVELGHLYGRMVRDFLGGRECRAVASHGHTVFHLPQRGLTTQIGDPDAIAAECGLQVVSGFRTLDVALGGQGAPLVPIGDALFFGQYDACLNLGGIANISHGRQTRTAYDICPCNMALNMLASRMGQDCDRDGATARRGSVDPALLAALEGLEYYRQPAPKTLGREWFESEFAPLLASHPMTEADALRTVVEHIARRTAHAAHEAGASSMLATGGGAHNTLLVERIAALAEGVALTVPDRLTVDYKEALVFALLGYMRLNGRVNTLRSVTGARADSVGGSVSGFFGKSHYAH